MLEVLERYPSVPMLKLAVELAKTPALKEDAAKTSLAIAQKIGGQSVDVQQLITQLGQEPCALKSLQPNTVRARLSWM